MTSDYGYWTSAARARVSRRRVLAGAAALVGAATVGGVACGDDGSGKSANPRYGGTLRIGTTLPIASGLDPQIETGTGLEIFPRVYGYPFHVDMRDDSLVYDHAVSVEQPDPTTYLVKLRPDVRFQDIAPVGRRAVTSQDVAESIVRYRDNPLVSSKTWHATVLDKIETPDTSTVRITTRRPYVYSLGELGGVNAGAILPSELIDAKTDISSIAVGSGPFRLDAVSRTERARIVRNDDYYREGIPYLDAMEWSVFADEDARVAAFKAQDVDAVPNRDSSEAQRLREFSDAVQVSTEPSLAWVSLGLRVDRAPFNDPRVRGAIDLALDRDALIRDIAFGAGDVLGPVNPHLAGGYWSLPRADVLEAHSGTVAIEERRAGARALLEAAGAGGASFKLQVAAIPQMIDVATVVQQQLRSIGLEIAMEELDLLVWFTNVQRGQFEAAVIGHPPYESPDIPLRFFHSGGPGGTGSMFGFKDGAIDQMIERSWGESDRSTRRNTLLDVQKLMLKARPMIQLFTGIGYSSAWSYVRNRRTELIGSAAQYNYEQWFAPR